MKIKNRISWSLLVPVILLAGSVLFSACEKFAYQTESIDPEKPVLFQTQIQPIFTNNCITCHKGSRNPDLRDDNSYLSLQSGGYLSQPAEKSRLYSKLISGSHSPYTIDSEKQLIFNWIKQGALNN
jgi:hypothetical protein